MLVTDLVRADRKAPLGHGQADVEAAFGIPGAAYELGVAPEVLDRKHPAADRAFAEVHLLGGPVPDIVADHLLVCLELVEGMVEHLPGLLDHVLPGPLALLDQLHVRLERLGHPGFGNRIGMLFERFGNYPPDKGRAERCAFHVLPRDQLGNHFVPGALRAKAEPLPSAGSVWTGCSGQAAGSPSLRD